MIRKASTIKEVFFEWRFVLVWVPVVIVYMAFPFVVQNKEVFLIYSTWPLAILWVVGFFFLIAVVGCIREHIKWSKQ